MEIKDRANVGLKINMQTLSSRFWNSCLVLEFMDNILEYDKEKPPTVVALAEWLRRVPAKYMGFPRESSNLSGDVVVFSVLNLLLQC